MSAHRLANNCGVLEKSSNQVIATKKVNSHTSKSTTATGQCQKAMSKLAKLMPRKTSTSESVFSINTFGSNEISCQITTQYPPIISRLNTTNQVIGIRNSK